MIAISLWDRCGHRYPVVEVTDDYVIYARSNSRQDGPPTLSRADRYLLDRDGRAPAPKSAHARHGKEMYVRPPSEQFVINGEASV